MEIPEAGSPTLTRLLQSSSRVGRMWAGAVVKGIQRRPFTLYNGDSPRPGGPLAVLAGRTHILSSTGPGWGKCNGVRSRREGQATEQAHN